MGVCWRLNMAKPVIREGSVSVVAKDIIKRFTLNFTDIVNNNNKVYNLEIIEATNGNYFLYTSYGRVGGTLIKEYRACSNRSDAEREADKIIKSKLKKGYVEVKLIQASIGSEIGRSKIDPSVISENEAKKFGFTIKEEKQSSLHPAIQEVVKVWFGSIEKFVVNTLDTSKCALGQLSIEQINKGRDLLLKARKLVASGGRDITELNNISSKYYSNIPMNFGYRRLNAEALRFDTNDKLDAAFDILDTLEGAKDVEKILTKKTFVDEQYASLKTGMEWVDPKDPIWNWINSLFIDTWVSSHRYLGNVVVSNVFRLNRQKEYAGYIKQVEEMCGKNQKRVELPPLLKKCWAKKPKEEKEYESQQDLANILPLFHGTRNENFVPILQTSLRFRRPGFSVSGSMFDKNGALYFGHSSKSCGYSSLSGSYWAKGASNKAFLFVSDVACGKQTIAAKAYPYTLESISPSMSVWAKAGSSVINDEYIVYTEKQNWLRYLVEITKR